MTLLQKLFLIRTCSDAFFRHRSRPCLLYQLQRCSAPCMDLIDQKNYQKSVYYARLFLEGKSDSIIEEMSQKMDEFSARLEFESARKCRDQIVHLRKIQAGQCVDLKTGEVDVIGFVKNTRSVCIEVMTIRGGRLLASQAYFFTGFTDADESELLSDFLSQYYLRFKESNNLADNVLPQQILLNNKLLEGAWIQQALSTIFSKKVEIKVPLRGKALRWIQLCLTNAEHSLNQHFVENQKIEEKITALSAVLKIKNHSDLRMECFDISHTGGEETVASCVVFDKNGPLKKAYRRFNVKGIAPGDDYAALHFALLKRFKSPESKTNPWPNILIMDGGKGQVKQAKNALSELNIQGICLIGIAKGAGRKPQWDKIFLADTAKPLSLAADSSVLHLIQQIRDEAHRFAITGHRKRRAKSRSTSSLNAIPGIGNLKAGQLLRYFGGLQALKKATQEDIAKVEGIGEVLAAHIYTFFHS